MVREIDAGMTEPLYDELRNNGGGFDGSTFTVALELLQVGGTVWAPATDYAVGDLVRPVEANGRVYECSLPGMSDTSNEPVWPTIFGGTVHRRRRRMGGHHAGRVVVCPGGRAGRRHQLPSVATGYELSGAVSGDGHLRRRGAVS